MENKEYIELFLEDQNNENTKSGYSTHLNVFLEYFEKTFPNKSLLDVNQIHITKFFKFLNKSQEWSLSTKRIMLSRTKLFLIDLLSTQDLYEGLEGMDKMNKRLEIMELTNFLMRKKNNMLKWDKSGHKPSNSNKEVVLEISELKEFFKLMYEKGKASHEVMFRVLVETGCRVEEFCSILLDFPINSHSIPIEDDLKERMIRVKWIKTEDKEEKGFRLYPISLELKTMLEAWVQTKREEHQIYLFPTKSGKKLHRTHVWYTVNKMYFSKITPNKSVSPHVFRHTLNYHRGMKGCPEDVRAFLLNHGTGNVNQEYMKGHLTNENIIGWFDEYDPYEEIFLEWNNSNL